MSTSSRVTKDFGAIQELSWFKNNNSDYKKSYGYYGENSVSYSNSDEYIDLFRTRGGHSIERIMKNIK